jgi:hypothetical protein
MSPARLARDIAAAVVAVIAASSSYSHMVDVAQRYGERQEVALALPISVDGMLIVASAAMVEDKRAGRTVRWSARIAFAAGVGASVAANIAAAQPTLGARIVAAWPALALLLVVEMLARPARRATPVTADNQPAATAAVTPDAGLTTSVAVDAATAAAVPDQTTPIAPATRRQPRPARAATSPGPNADTTHEQRHRSRRPASETRRLAETIMTAEPQLSRTQLAARLGVSRQWLHELLGKPADDGTDPLLSAPHPSARRSVGLAKAGASAGTAKP